MCNLYSLTKGQAAIRDWFCASNDRTGNLPLFPGIFPDQMAPIVRNEADGERERVMARWGMSGPPQFGALPPPISAMLGVRAGAAGLASKTAASRQQRRFASTPTRKPARRRSGSR
jgi:putative SOS response-associated peptidase YedK